MTDRHVWFWSDPSVSTSPIAVPVYPEKFTKWWVETYRHSMRKQMKTRNKDVFNYHKARCDILDELRTKLRYHIQWDIGDDILLEAQEVEND